MAADTTTTSRDLVLQVRSDEFRSQVALALPDNVSPKRFQRAAVTALLTNPDIATCDIDSVFNSLLRAAQDGLIPDGREAALVKYGTKAQYLPMVGGYRKIAAEHGWSIRAQIVYANDDFNHEFGLEESLAHRPVRPGGDRGPMIAAYAVGTHRDGRKQWHVMYADDIERVKRSSRASGKGPWVDWPDRMWEKTVARRLFKELPLDPGDIRIARVAAAGNGDDPATTLYGSSQAPPAPLAGGNAAAAVPPTDATPDGAGPSSGGTPDQAAAAGGPPAAADPGPETDFSDEPGAAEVEGFDEDEVNAAAEQKVPNGVNKGLTLAQVAAKGKDGEDWLLWCLRKWANDSFRAAVELFVQARLDSVWKTYQDGLQP